MPELTDQKFYLCVSFGTSPEVDLVKLKTPSPSEKELMKIFEDLDLQYHYSDGRQKPKVRVLVVSDESVVNAKTIIKKIEEKYKQEDDAALEKQEQAEYKRLKAKYGD